MARQRCVYLGDRAQQVLDFCREPQSMADIMAKFGAEQARFAVYNLVKREKMVNLNAGQGRGVPGLYVAVSTAATMRAYIPPAPRYDASALLSAWK